MSRKLSAIRQLSLQCEPPPAAPRRSSLKKQLSEDLSNEDFMRHESVGIRISLSAKNRPLKTPSIKVAWVDNNRESLENNDDNGTLPKKENSRENALLKGDSSVTDDDSNVLYSRQDLAEKLRQAWREREKSKKSLSIFLAQNHHSFCHDDDDTITTNNEEEIPKPTVPKLILPMQPEVRTSDFKTIFHKQLRKVTKSPRLPTPCNYIPSKRHQEESSTTTTRTQQQDFSTNNCKTIVVVPIVERPEGSPQKSMHAETSEDDSSSMKHDEDAKAPQANISSTLSASTRRDLFKKRTNSAFNGTTVTNTNVASIRPPLIRSSSVPTAPKTSKFLLATASKRKTKSKVPSKRKSQIKDGKEEALVEPKKCSDIVTMVSLVSPSESEHEDADPEPAPMPKASPKKATGSHDLHASSTRNFSLRKTVKQVSFQQSTIHAVRSFSASFPSRRASMATAALLGSAVKKLQKGLTLEKRGQTAADRDEIQLGPKRRLVRSVTIAAATASSEGNDVQLRSTSEDVKPNATKTKPTTTTRECKQEELHQQIPRNSNEMKEAAKNTDEPLDETKDETPKEKECWETYRRMNARGISVSYDTILRGMLTPTEYRLRRKLSLQRSEDNC